MLNSSFLPKILPHLMIFQSSTHQSLHSALLWKIIKNGSKNLAKNEENPYWTFVQTRILKTRPIIRNSIKYQQQKKVLRPDEKIKKKIKPYKNFSLFCLLSRSCFFTFFPRSCIILSVSLSISCLQSSKK